MLMAARAMQGGLSLLKPYLTNDVNLIGLSALLTTTMPNMKATIDVLETAGIRDLVKVIIGGAPVTEAHAKQIGADGYSPEASAATRLAKSLVAALRPEMGESGYRTEGMPKGVENA
jgi:methanogenic corrinoid protein MtbC1